MNKLALLYIAFKFLTCNCHKEFKNGFTKNTHPHTQKIGQLPPIITESSGLAKTNDSLFFTHNDSGGEAKLFLLNAETTIIKTIQVPNSRNFDWEDLAQDKKGSIFIGDFGNNSQSRTDLVIYKFVPNHPTETIRFSYADQTDFPATSLQFDCEAFFWHNDSLYLFTKSYEPKHMQTKLYVLPDKAGTYRVSPTSSFAIDTPVTAADISPDGKEFALLTYGKLLTFAIENQRVNFSFPQKCIKFKKKQTEALIYQSANEWLITNEQGSIYSLKVN